MQHKVESRGMAGSAAQAAPGEEGTDAARRRTGAAAAGSCRGFGSIRSIDFETDEGSASLADLFRGRSQLLVYHFMFGPDYKAGCPSCSAIADGFNGFADSPGATTT